MSILSGQALWQSKSRVQRCLRTDFPRCLGRYWPFADPSSLIKRWAYDDFFLVRGEISSVAIVDMTAAIRLVGVQWLFECVRVLVAPAMKRLRVARDQGIPSSYDTDRAAIKRKVKGQSLSLLKVATR